MKLKLWMVGLSLVASSLDAQMPNPIPQNSPQDATYKIRYKGIRCLKSKSSKGDEITIYVMGYSADTKLRDTETLPLDSMNYKLQVGSYYATNALAFTGKNAEDVNLFCAILQQDQSQKTKDFWAGSMEPAETSYPM
ncbi:MAG: hypothetical protein RLZZ628_2650 [Bacteroidota bacterium]|jgi:hypothetical protein